jgi:putative transposase
MKLIEGETDVYGYRKLTNCLKRRYKLIINKKKVYRLCKELDILMPTREKKNKYPRRLARNRVVTGSNQLWQMDIKYGYVTSSRRFFYLASIIDVYDRSIVGHYSGKVCEAKHIVKMMQKALLRRQIYGQENKLIIRTDNGPQFCSNLFQEFCGDWIEHERIPPRSPNMNAYIESFHSVLERECYQRNEFRTFEEAYRIVDDYIDFYNHRRLHGSLKDCPPQEFFEEATKGRMKLKEIAL